ncbi:MAG: HAMP domain-containing histidine kinase [Anaerolineae bacterium]|jgi:signal transduction histidine kinase|nr:HAMP domain-containing histidine kinase [Anaerolineae bacterium]
MPIDGKLDLQAVLDGLGEGVLLFTSDGKLITENLAARAILGTDLNVLREKGWPAATVLFNTKQTDPDQQIDAIRARAMQSERPLRFHIYRSGSYVPCWAAAVQGESGEVFTMITLETTDWSAMTGETDRFRAEMREAVEATQGHIDLINQSMKVIKKNESVETLSKRLGGFTRLISIHMHRVARFMEMFERLEDIRTGRLRETVKQRKRKLDLNNYFEDFLEELDEIMLVDPETDANDHRARITTTIPKNTIVNASSQYLTRILRDMLRNAIMYSMKASPIKINIQTKNQMVQIDLVDEGYGVRQKERERVFEPFARARQPQIMGEFGYGLSLYLCKHEVEAMNGRLWFDSEEGVGTTFSLTLPVWVDETAAASSSSDSILS